MAPKLLHTVLQDSDLVAELEDMSPEERAEELRFTMRDLKRSMRSAGAQSQAPALGVRAPAKGKQSPPKPVSPTKGGRRPVLSDDPAGDDDVTIHVKKLMGK